MGLSNSGGCMVMQTGLHLQSSSWIPTIIHWDYVIDSSADSVVPIPVRRVGGDKLHLGSMKDLANQYLAKRLSGLSHKVERKLARVVEWSTQASMILN